jgi:hypothetical protein
VLDPGVNEGIRTGAMWCWTNARWVSFFYSPSRDSDSVRRFLGGDLRRTVPRQKSGGWPSTGPPSGRVSVLAMLVRALRAAALVVLCGQDLAGR